MRQKSLWIAAGCILAVVVVPPIFSSGASPASKEKVLYSFKGDADGGYPLSDLTIDSGGDLYGTTSIGGIVNCGFNQGNGCGTVFELKHSESGWQEKVLYSFKGGNDGETPEAGLIFDKVGNLYGTTPSGGRNEGGVVFKLTPDSQGGWTQSVIYAFNCSSGSAGCSPQADLALDAEGNLYGTTSYGSDPACFYQNNGGCGAVFELMPQSGGGWKETTLYAFAGPPGDGAIPVAGIVFDLAGNIFGTTRYGGKGSCENGTIGLGQVAGCGTVYKLTHSGGVWTETVLYSILPGNGFGTIPTGELFFHNPNHLLGVTRTGGDGLGTVFELVDTQTKGWNHPREAHIFYGSPDGEKPVGRLIGDQKGGLLGVTSGGGPTRNQFGIIFQLRLSTNGAKESILYSFTGPPDGDGPSAGLVSDSKGHVFGTTQLGGKGAACIGGCGTVYELTP
jgi:uncharacterized repeat protein (TIGR03803 family)